MSQAVVFKYCSFTGFDILINSRLKASLINSFNDPFEVQFGWDVVNAVSDIGKEHKADPGLLDRWKLSLKELGIEYDPENEHEIIGKVADFQINDLDRVLQKIRASWNKSLGIVCLSKKADIIQMWSHYADSHRGIVIGFDEGILKNSNGRFEPVDYKDDMILLPISATSTGIDRYEPLIKSALLRKHSYWKYEDEVRVYANLDERDLDGNFYIKIPIESVKELYVGLRSPAATKLLAESLVSKSEYHHIKLYQMSPDKQAYRLKPLPLTTR